MYTTLVALAGVLQGIMLAPAIAEADSDVAAHVARLDAEGIRVLEGLDGWWFFTPELRHLTAGPFWGEAAAGVSRATRADAADPLPAIRAFHAALQAKGVHLLIVPVPAKAEIHADALPEPFTDADFGDVQATFFDRLRADGIDVLDLSEPFRANRKSLDAPLYCKTDSHWSGQGTVLAAEAIAAHLAGRVDLPPGDAGFGTAWREITIEGDLARMLPDAPPAPERVRVRQVFDPAAGEHAPVAPDPASPIVLLGDSHALVFHAGDDMHARGAGLADQLAVTLGRPVDLVAVRGSGATPARVNLFRRAQRQPGYWEDKTLVIWCFALREFTQSDGWRIVPIAPD